MRVKILAVILIVIILAITDLFTRDIRVDFSSEINRKDLIYSNQSYRYLNGTSIDFLKDCGRTGKGIKIAMIDSYLSTDYVKVTKMVSFIKDETIIVDKISHATISAQILKRDISPDIELYSVQALNSLGVGTYADLIKGIDWSIENDIDIIMFSLTGNEYLKELHEAVKTADQKNIIMIAAAGNYSSESPVYPAAFPEVIAIGALNSQDEIADYSNFGPYVDVYAPGEVPEYDVYGTSFAVPYAAGFIALLKDNCNISNDEIKEMFGCLKEYQSKK